MTGLSMMHYIIQTFFLYFFPLFNVQIPMTNALMLYKYSHKTSITEKIQSKTKEKKT